MTTPEQRKFYEQRVKSLDYNNEEYKRRIKENLKLKAHYTKKLKELEAGDEQDR
jgi:hypothetical protein